MPTQLLDGSSHLWKENFLIHNDLFLLKYAICQLLIIDSEMASAASEQTLPYKVHCLEFHDPWLKIAVPLHKFSFYKRKI